MNRDHPQANDLQNLRLAHAICNNFASNHTFANKVQIRYLMREDITVRGRLMTKAGSKNLRRTYGIDSKKRRRIGVRVRLSYRKKKHVQVKRT